MHIEYGKFVYCCRHTRLMDKKYWTGERFYPTVLAPNIGSLFEIKEIRQAIKDSLRNEYDESLLMIANLNSGLSISYAEAAHLCVELKEEFGVLRHYDMFYILDAILSEHEKLIYRLKSLCKYKHRLKLKLSVEAKEIISWLLLYFNLDLKTDLGFYSNNINSIFFSLDCVYDLVNKIQERVKNTHELVLFNSYEQEDDEEPICSIIIFPLT